MDDPPTRGLNTYSGRDVSRRTAGVVRRIAHILLNAGANANALDTVGATPLHYAALGGLQSLVNELLIHGADPNAVERVTGHTPLHLSAIQGYAEICEDLIAKGADPNIKDYFGNSFEDIAAAPGPKLGSRLKAPSKKLPDESALTMAYKYGNGGWSGPTILEADWNRCDVDMLNASTVSAVELRDHYLSINRPFLLRGLNEKSPAWSAYTSWNLRASHGALEVLVSDIPYAEKYGSKNSVR